MNFSIGWPQLIWLCMGVLYVINETIHHGETKTKERDGAVSFISLVLSGLLLYWGGFFG